MSYSISMLSVHTSPLDTPGRTKDAGGMNVYIRELARELAQQDLNIDIFTRWTNEETPAIVELAPNLRVIHIKAGPVTTVHKNELHQYLPLFARHIEEFRLSEQKRYDVLHSHYWLSGIAGVQLAYQWDVPHVTMFHTVGRLKQLANPNEPEPALRLEMEQRLVQQVDRIIVATEEERTQLIRYCGATARQVDVIPCGVDLRLFSPQNQQEARGKLGLPFQQPMVLFVGRLDPFKGPDLFLRAAAIMRQKAQILLVGGQGCSDGEVQKLRQLAAQLRLGSRVHFLPACPQQELPTLYSAADVTVVPSYHESFGLVAIESQACGTPVVATRSGGLTTVVRHGETGFLVPRWPGSFAECIDTILQNTELRQQMRTRAIATANQFSWQSVAQRVEKLYTALINDSSCLVAQ